MGEAKRRRGRLGRDAEGETEGKPDEVLSEVVAYLLDGAVDRELLFGPVVWRPSDGTSARQWYFIVVGCGLTGETWHDQIFAETQPDAVEMRARVMAALVNLRPCVMHDFDDELEMARWAEATWPCSKITRIREGVEAQRRREMAQ